MITLTNDTLTVGTARYFSGKKTGVPIIDLQRSFDKLDFNTCLRQCVPSLKVFTDEVGTNFFRNDFYRMFINIIPSGTVRTTLYKNEVEYNVTDNTYGLLETETLTNGSYYTYRFDFFKIWQSLGYGEYRFKVENLTGLTVVQEINSPCFTLRKYSDEAADRTVRIETIQNGILQHGNNYSGKLFTQQIRFSGALTFTGNTTESEDLTANNITRSRIQIKTTKIPTYTLDIDLVSAQQISRVLFNYLLADTITVTDYNVFNHSIDPLNPEAERMNSIPLRVTDESFEPSARQIKRSYRFEMQYDNDNIFKYK